MKPLSQLLVPAVMLAAVVSAADQRLGPAEPETEAAVASGERSAEAKSELRPTQNAAGDKRPAIRVILPSPYSGQR